MYLCFDGGEGVCGGGGEKFVYNVAVLFKS